VLAFRWRDLYSDEFGARYKFGGSRWDLTDSVNSGLTHGGISRFCVTLVLLTELPSQVSGRDSSEGGVMKRLRNDVDMQKI